MERLNEGLQRNLTIVSAPAGFGKTSVLSAWLADCPHPAAWLSLDEDDGDPLRFLNYVVAALQTIAPSAGSGILDMLQTGQLPPVESLLVSLVNDLATIPQTFILVLDDYHMTESPAVDDALNFLIRHLPPQMHLVIATREDPQLPLARLRARGQLTEIRVSDLRFTHEESTAFFQQMTGLHLSVDDIAALDKRTEGWIAGLQMAALSMQGRSDSGDFIQAFTGSHRFVLDYLVEEVLQRQSDTIREFLLRTSILDRLSGSLCEAVTGDANSKRMLDHIERGNLFVISLDDQRQWYRYHHLFADALKAHLIDEHRDEVPGLHRRASRWYETQNLMAEAIRHALASGDMERSADLIESVWQEMDAAYQSPAWMRWATQLPESIIESRPILNLGFGWSLLNAGDVDGAEARLREAERWLDTSANAESSEMVVVNETQFRALPASIAAARAYGFLMMGDTASTIAQARIALDRVNDTRLPAWEQATALLGIAHWADGNLEEANRVLDDLRHTLHQQDNLRDAVGIGFIGASIRMEQGQFHEALRTCEESLSLAADSKYPQILGTEDIYRVMSEIVSEWNELTTAVRHMETAENYGEQSALPDFAFRLYTTQARVYYALGDRTAAMEAIDEAERQNTLNPLPDIRSFEAFRAQIWIEEGQLDKARAWAESIGLNSTDEFSYTQEFSYTTYARLLIEEGQFDQAAQLLKRLLDAARKDKRLRSVIKLLILHARIQIAQNDTSTAQASLKESLTLAEPEGLIRSFIEEGPQIIQLLSQMAAADIMPVYIQRLLTAYSADQTRAHQAATYKERFLSDDLIEALSDRELEVLQLVADGLSNREIGERLFLALDTVKGHNRRIYAKLQVQRRTEAVARARELGLI